MTGRPYFVDIVIRQGLEFVAIDDRYELSNGHVLVPAQPRPARGSVNPLSWAVRRIRELCQPKISEASA